MGLRWQDEEKWLYNLIYAPEKERWEKSKNTELGFSHWCAYLSEYAELRREEIADIKRKGFHYENTINIVNDRIKRHHSKVWVQAMDWYIQQ
jgi:hypothetical protein